MGTVPLVDNLRVTCSDGTVVRLEAVTWTDDLMMGPDGSASVSGEVEGVEVFAFGLPLQKFSDLWLDRFCNALAADAGFRDGLGEVTDGGDLVVPAVPARNGEQLAALVRKGGGAKFKDFVGLRSGRDRFSGMRLPDLEAEAGERASSDLAKRMTHVPPDKAAAERAKVLRWFLRGLPLAMAVRKVDVDREVSQNVAGRSR